MAIAYTHLTDISATGTNPTTASVSPNTGDLLVALPGVYNGTEATEPTAASWDAISMAKAIGFEGTVDNARWFALQGWYLQIAAGDSSAISFTEAGGTDYFGAVFKVTGHNTGTPIGATSSQEQSNSTAETNQPSLTLVTEAGDMVVSMCASEGSLTAGGGQTMIGATAGCSYKIASGASTTVSWSISPAARGYVHIAFVIKAAAGGGGGGGDGTDLPSYVVGARPVRREVGSRIAAQEAGLRFIDAPDAPILEEYVFAARPVRRPKTAPNPGGLWMPTRLPDAAPVVLSDLPRYWYCAVPQRRPDPARVARATVAIVQTPIVPVAPPQPVLRVEALRPRYPNPQSLIQRLTLGQRLVDATVPVPPPPGGTDPLVAVTKRRRHRRRRKRS